MKQIGFSIMRRPVLGAVLVIALLLGLGSVARSYLLARGDVPCPEQAELPPAALPQARAARLAGQPLIIVTLGSSSTQSWMSSDPAHSYPAQLQTMLNEALPEAHVAVLNRGVGGQDAPEELARLQADVIAVRPQVVIWQVGANGALRDVDPAEFTRLVTEGVERLQAAGIDVVLMDNQRAPRLLAARDNTPIDAALATIAERTGASLFARSTLMDDWAASGHPYAEFVSRDGLHHNNQGYRCVARALGATLLAGLEAPSLAAPSAEAHSLEAPRLEGPSAEAPTAAATR